MRGDEERGGETREMRGGSKQRRKGETVCLCASLPLTLVLTPCKREELLKYNSHQSWTVEHLQQTRSRQEIR